MCKLFVSSLKGETWDIKGIDETNWIENCGDLVCRDVELVGLVLLGGWRGSCSLLGVEVDSQWKAFRVCAAQCCLK